MIPLWLLGVSLLGAPPLDGAKLEEALRHPINMSWKPRPLDEGLRELEHEYNFRLMLDRRVNRAYQAHGSFRQTSLEVVLDLAAKLVGCRAVLLGGIVLVAPDAVADRVATMGYRVREKVAKLDAEVLVRMQKRRDLVWEKETSARVLLEDLAKEAGFKLVAEEALDIPLAPEKLHFAATVDLVLAVLAQCDRSLEIDQENERWRAVPLTDGVVEKRIRSPKPQGAKFVSEASKAVPNLSVEADGQYLVARGSWLALRDFTWYLARVQAEEFANANRKKAPTKGPRRTIQLFTLTVRNATLERFAQVLQEKSRLKVLIDEVSLEKVGKSKSDRVDCSVSNLTLDQLLQQVLGPLDLRFSISNKEVRIYGEETPTTPPKEDPQ